jgi:triosephosphate isomerase
MEGQDRTKKYIVGGNWKCNGSVQSVKDLVSNVLNKLQFSEDKAEVFVAPVSIHIASVKALVNKNIKVAAQNMSATGSGAFTGEISGEQLKDFEVNWVILGHSERRQHYNDTNEVVATKVAKAQTLGLHSCVCVGESEAQREAGETNAHLKEQLDAVKGSISDWSRIVLAYEPIWAIGTGKTATPEIAEETHVYIRQWLTENIGEELAQSVRIQYGGSVNAKNCASLIEKPNIDGFLVGGAALKPEFLDIVASCSQ